MLLALRPQNHPRLDLPQSAMLSRRKNTFFAKQERFTLGLGTHLTSSTRQRVNPRRVGACRGLAGDSLAGASSL
jgi:hypothetical protein